MKEEKQSTKSCPLCGNTQLLLMQTLNKKACTDCSIEIPWCREAAQLPFYNAGNQPIAVGHSRVDSTAFPGIGAYKLARAPLA